jgi:hypothetical protein
LVQKKRHKGIFMSLLPWPARPAIGLTTPPAQGRATP